MRVELATLRRSAKQMGNVGEDLQRVVETLRASLEAEGECWGHDEAGQSFAGNYVPNRDKVLESMVKAGEPIGSIGRNLATTATNTENDDQRIGGGFTDVQRQI